MNFALCIHLVLAIGKCTCIFRAGGRVGGFVGGLFIEEFSWVKEIFHGEGNGFFGITKKTMYMRSAAPFSKRSLPLILF